MPYVSTHFGIDVEFRPNMADDQQVDVDINISPVPMPAFLPTTKIGAVYLNGNHMTDLESMSGEDAVALDALRKTMELEETVLPHTILTFAELRLRRYRSEIEKCRAALRLARDSLEEITIDPGQFDFGPAYGGAQQRQADAIRACAKALGEAE